MSEKSIGSKIGEIFKHTSAYALASIAQSAASFMLLPIYVKKFSPEEYGIYSLVLMCGSIGSAIFYLGINSAFSRSYFDYDTKEKRNKVFSTSLLLTGIGSLIFCLLGLFGGGLISQLIFDNQNYLSHIRAVCFSASASILNQVFLTYFRMEKKTSLVVVSGFLSVLITLLLTCVLILNFKLGIWAPIMSTLFVQIAVLLYYTFICRREVVSGILIHEVYVQLKFGAPTVLTSFAVMAIEWSDRIVLQKTLTTTEVGIYSLAFRIGSMITPIFINPFSQVLAPALMEYRRDQNHKNFVLQLFNIYVFIGVLAVVAALVFTDVAFKMLIHNAEYHAAIQLVPFILAGNIMNGLNNFFSVGLLYERKILNVSKIYYFGAVCYIGSSILLSHWMGMKGVAVSCALTNLLIPSLLYFSSKKYFHLDFEVFRLLGVATCLVLLFFFMGSFRWGGISLLVLLEKASIFLGIIFFYYFIALNKNERDFIRLFTKRMRGTRASASGSQDYP